MFTNSGQRRVVFGALRHNKECTIYTRMAAGRPLWQRPRMQEEEWHEIRLKQKVGLREDLINYVNKFGCYSKDNKDF